MSSPIIAIHGGVGVSSADLEIRCYSALKTSTDLFTAVSRLEDDEYFNAGYGSNLNRDGEVECEACAMYSEQMRFGAVGAVRHLANPVRIAAELARCQDEQNMGLVQPLVLVGDGAEAWAANKGFTLCTSQSLIAPRAQTRYEKAKNILGRMPITPVKISDEVNLLVLDDPVDDGNRSALDTVGGIELTPSLSCVACLSSGGISMKRPGRLGQSAHFGAGVWAEQWESFEMDDGEMVRKLTSVSISLSGCGEVMIRTNFARILARSLRERLCDSSTVSVVSSTFLREISPSSPLLASISPSRLLVGGLVVVAESYPPLPEATRVPCRSPGAAPIKQAPVEWGETMVELVVFHNAPLFPVAFRDRRGKTRKVLSKLNGGNLQCIAYAL